MLAVVKIRKEPYYRRAAIESGLKRLGYTITESGTPSGPNDVLCLWNRKRGLEEKMAEAWERAGGTVLVFENGYLAKQDKTHYAIAVHQHNGAGWAPYDDSEDRFAKLSFELKPMRSGERHLVLGQRSIGSALMASPPQWAEKKAKELKQAFVRPHPGQFPPRTALLDDLRNVGVCHTWASSAAVRALVEGVAVQRYAPHWICDGWSANRETALNYMAHSQWHHEEVATGEPFARMRDENWGPRTWR